MLDYCEGNCLVIFYLFIMQVYLCEKMSLVNEMYFAITLDRSSAGPVRSQTQYWIFVSAFVNDLFYFR